MKPYAMYLRKSRADLEAEARGEGETLSRHRTALLQLANARGLHVARIYEEVVSGDSIEARPQMQALLSDVESGLYAGVIVNDADRLARGDSIDQGIVKRAFYATGTLIITPYKTYDPANTSDEDFFDFSLFMARFEYKMIKRRMQTGRMRSAAEGNYLGTLAPYGYRRVKRADRAGWTLEPDPETAPIVQMMFRWYAAGDIGSWGIADRLNAMGQKTSKGAPFTTSTVLFMLKNPTYIGRTTWAKKLKATRFEDGKKVHTRETNAAPICVDNAHPAIIDMELWDAVQAIMHGHRPMPKNKMARVANVLAGLVYCSECGKAMQRKAARTPQRPDIICCVTRNCPTSGIAIPALEQAVLDAVKGWAIDYSAPESQAQISHADAEIAAADKAIATLDKQLSSLQDLLEQGIYSPQEYIQRRDDLRQRRQAAEDQRRRAASTPSDADCIRANMPQIHTVLDAYNATESIESRNALLKSIISRIVYKKTQRGYNKVNPAKFLTLTIYPRRDVF